MISKRALILGAVLSLAALPLAAHGPTPQTAEQTIEIAAPADTVWEVLGNPATLADWHPDVAGATMEGEGPGSKRIVEFKSGGTVTDGIDRIEADAKEIRWRLSQEDIEVVPVSYYTNSVKIEPAGDGSSVTWNASFFRADTTNEPQEKFSDEAAVAAMEAYIQNGLGGLKESVENAE